MFYTDETVQRKSVELKDHSVFTLILCANTHCIPRGRGVDRIKLHLYWQRQALNEVRFRQEEITTTYTLDQGISQ